MKDSIKVSTHKWQAASMVYVEFAYALLTSTLLKHNEQICANIEKRSPKPIQAYNSISTVLMSENFGLTSPNEQSPLPPSKVHMKDFRYSQVIDFLTRMEMDTE